MSDKMSFSLLTDLYELTMIQGYFLEEKNIDVIFDMFFRKNPFNGGYTIFAGLETLLEILKNLKFNENDIDYLDSLKIFKKEFLDYLNNFKFTGTIYAVDEGEVVFPNEPLIRVETNIIEAQLIESLVLNIINFQTLIATKTSRIVQAANGGGVLEFGLRRAHGPNGALMASRAAYIGGAIATSNTLAGKIYNIPVAGTMAHSWVMAYNSEIEAFRAFANIYSNNAVLLVDTYDTLSSGIPNAIKVFKELKSKGYNKNFGIRIDSGDLEFLSKQARKMLDQVGLSDVKIYVSNELDEYIIDYLIHSNAPIDAWGVGTNLVTAKGDPSLSGVYKISAIKTKEGNFKPVIKISNSIEKTTNPYIKNIIRFRDENKNYLLDLIITDDNEQEDPALIKAKNNIPIKCCHPFIELEYITLAEYSDYKILLKKYMDHGNVIIKLPDLKDIQKNTKNNLNFLDKTYKRFINPHIYKVSLSERLKEMKFNMIKQFKN